jgi:RNA polymerase sigma-70 factor (ECF subfamily)
MTRLRDRDAAAMEAIYDRHSRSVYSVLLRITRDPEIANELLQDTFIRLWRSAETYESARGTLAPWLLTLARNLALDHFRSKGEKQRKREEKMEVLPIQSFAPQAEEWVDQRRVAVRVRYYVGELPDDQQKALQLAYFEGLSHSEIAQKLSKPLGTVKTWLRSALQQLREQMGGSQ